MAKREKDMKKFLYILVVAFVFDLLYSNSDYYISSYLWKHINDKGIVYGDNIIFTDSLYIRNYTKIQYYGKDHSGEIAGRYLLCFNFGFESRLWIYSEIDSSIGLYRNVIPLRNHTFE